eukprot:TRINITY_DN80342_c0_g1_i1.p1 TRINITY_DN80342_c0_g1~~TRINITY_DN80342_c0_g1_i1.p1  ORF type:complete len:279 (-),score=47.20 TRINITY_DN80342_c0_g1_i1:213-1049(-)
MGAEERINGLSGNPPGRYVCQYCGTCLATSEMFQEARDSENVLVFSQLYGSAGAEKASKKVQCPCCQEVLGARTDTVFMLRKERVMSRAERLEILVCSLKPQEIQDVTSVLSDVFPHSNITPKVLQKSELRGFQLAARPLPELVVVVHRNEGRVLLTDRNGFYHDVLGSAWQLTRGNVLVVLTRTELKAESELYDGALLKSLSTQGDQPTIGAISALGRVLTWESSPSKPQREQLQTLTSKAYFREAPVASQGIPWKALPPNKMAGPTASNSAWCMLL